ncbi:hypothetical protein [Nocardia nova]|uniref:hypothetical protein n=1 Tax=Nocardia nova TaxID=37330 RepID=UPI0033FF5781
MTGPLPIPIHVDVPAPPTEAARSGPAEPAPFAQIVWAEHGVEPRWRDEETADCVAVLKPVLSDSPSFRRVVDGASHRGETLLVISTIGEHAESLYLPGFIGRITGSTLPGRARPALATGLNAADKDLGNRLLTTQADRQWWSLRLDQFAAESARGVEVLSPSIGGLEPILVDSLGAPVVAAWVQPRTDWRWYVVPEWADEKTLLDWLIQRALPTYAPSVTRRYRLAGAIEPEWQTPEEHAAGEALTAMSARHSAEQAQLEARLNTAQSEAGVVRGGLLHGTGDDLVDAVERVFADAGLSPVRLDDGPEGTWSADLLVTADGHQRLVEVKSARGNASESMVAALLKHLGTWATNRPDQPVDGGTLIVSHQLNTEPSERDRRIYSRRDELPVPTISSLDLFDWWREGNWEAIRHAVMAIDERNAKYSAPENNSPTAGRAFLRRLRRAFRR